MPYYSYIDCIAWRFCVDPFPISKQHMSHIYSYLRYSIIITNSDYNQSIVDERQTNKRFFFLLFLLLFSEVRDNHPSLLIDFFCSIMMLKTKCVNKQQDANIDILSLVSVFFLLRVFFLTLHTHARTPEKREDPVA